MEEFDWSAPELGDIREQWTEDPGADLFLDNELDEEQTSDILLQDYEFDVQPRLLRKKEKKELEFFVEYDKLTNSIIEITPEKREAASSLRYGIFVTKQENIINKIFDGRIPLSRLHVKHNKDRSKEITLESPSYLKSEFDYVFVPDDNPEAVVHVYCDIVLKKISVVLDYEKLKRYMSSDNLSEHRLERNNGHFSLFCIDKTDRTRLHDKIDINIFELCNLQQIEKKCNWLPDSKDDFKKISFLHYNNELPLTFSLQNEYERPTLGGNYERPQIIYKQDGNKLFLQSIMQDTNNFKINEEITFYMFSKFDPTRLMEYKRINRSALNNFNLYEIELKSKDAVRLTTDHLHLHLEDNYASTYYRF
jgi:hypothetical protein